MVHCAKNYFPFIYHASTASQTHEETSAHSPHTLSIYVYFSLWLNIIELSSRWPASRFKLRGVCKILQKYIQVRKWEWIWQLHGWSGSVRNTLSPSPIRLTLAGVPDFNHCWSVIENNPKGSATCKCKTCLSLPILFESKCLNEWDRLKTMFDTF